jgi:hypothetical protein
MHGLRGRMVKLINLFLRGIYLFIEQIACAIINSEKPQGLHIEK